LNKPPLRLAIEFNKRVRGDDEWFDDPDEIVWSERSSALMISRTRWWQLEFSPIESREHKDLLKATREQHCSSHVGSSTTTT